MRHLPNGWALTSIADIVTFNPKTIADDSLNCAFAPMQYLGTRFRAQMNYEQRTWGEIKKSYVHFQTGDVIVAKVTPCFENGKAGVAPNLPNGIGAGSSEFCVFRPAQGINERYLLAWLSSEDFRKRAAMAMTGSVGLKRVPKEVFLTEEIPLAPEAEQRRIADKLDTTLARVDVLNDRLARITPLLKRFRQSVLAAATSGRLTEDWRSGALNWNEERLGKLAKFIDYRGKTPQKTTNGVPLITAKNVKPGYLNEEPREFIADEDYDNWMTRGFPKVGDVLLTTEAPLGNVVLIDWECKFALAQRLICLSFDERIIGDYAAIAMQSQEFQKKLIEQSSGSTVAGIKASRLKELILSIPQINEQTEIVRRVKTLFAFADRLEARLQFAQTAAERLTPALLAKAFRGELLPQDPNDEPATELLRRLREARAADTASKPKRGRKSGAATPVAGT